MLTQSFREALMSHDAHIWRTSNVQPLLTNLHQNGHKRFFLLGDSGYPLRPWLLTPFLNVNPGSPEERFNSRHNSVRSLIERCNGVLKMRFRCLFKHRALHYAPLKATKIVNACVVLHNICRHFNVEDFVDEDNAAGLDFGIYNDLVYNQNPDEPLRVDRDLLNGRRFRQNIVETR
ncbi:Putative nuclease HARBI1-like Protein [Tribolium castaneum]|uniref:Nuclease HARBI1-like Protein n=1 Tax=Tribolium castaneum TaxID=7070 RepID=A0A139WG48_TRICA|nr:Putative nuclease HARBI1-like Protein [Tribolium castaneum]